MKVMAVIMCHNSPDTTDRLHQELVGVVDKMWVIDSGSDDGCRAKKTDGRVLTDNLYWTGCWNYALQLFESSDCDVLWVIGGDIELRSNPLDYIRAMESAWPFGCWHPVVDGVSRPLMQASHDKPLEVWHLEGIALAVSREAAAEFNRLPEDNKYGWGLDIWMCWRCWKSNQRNILDGRVKIFHPDLRGYSSNAAHQEMFNWFSKHVGGQWRDELHYWSDSADYNKVRDMKPVGVSVVVTSYNQRDTLELALDSLNRQTVAPLDVVVSDDGSTDDTLTWLDSIGDSRYTFRISYITRRHNGYNLVEANNVAAEKTRGSRIIFTNADIILEPNTVERHMILPDDTIGGGSIANIPLPKSKAVTREDVVKFDSIRSRAGNDQTRWVRGGNFSVSLYMFKTVGGFNSEYAGKYGSEHADFTKRAEEAGAVLQDVEAVGYHLAHPPNPYKEQQLGHQKFRNEHLGIEA